MRAGVDLAPYKGILPYASEIFGVYQPLLGWKSRRVLQWYQKAYGQDKANLLGELTRYYHGIADVKLNEDWFPVLASIELGQPAAARIGVVADSILAREVAQSIRRDEVPTADAWREYLEHGRLMEILNEVVFPYYQDDFAARARLAVASLMQGPNESDDAYAMRRQYVFTQIESDLRRKLNHESALAGLLHDLAQEGTADALNQIFLVRPDVDWRAELAQTIKTLQNDFKDPYLSFDPQKDIGNVALSPIGIVHLFRQYFFEFDTFLGPSTAHIWLSPGASVELVETTTRRTLTERIIEQSYETTTREERDTTNKDDISEAVKQDNRDDMKLGITSTVNQSWASGSASATASLNMDKTQQVAREKTHQRMREQTEKLSTEIRQNFKSTFRTVTEVTDTSSKRYVLANDTPDLINYEMRRKMRQVGVQVQDIGTYLSWQTFVDEPGRVLGLANLVHVAQPADLVPQPNQKEIPNPPARIEKAFQTNAVWDFGDNRKYNDPALGFVELAVIGLPVQPDAGYEIAEPDGFVGISVISYSGEDSQNARWGFRGKLIGDSQLRIGVVTGPGGIEWDERIDFVVGGTVAFKPSAAKLKEVADANADILKAKEAADRENERKQKEAFVKAAQERIKLASKIKQRKFEDLREEERIVVYRKLLRSLMSDQLYDLPENKGNDRTRHVLAELINSIFDVDKMLYFVAPEWWKPRVSSRFSATAGLGQDAVVAWSDQISRSDNYYITSESDPAPLGSSLGWLLQLDGDALRNAFLNAPWVKAVIPIRPGKEKAAIAWLQNVKVEGTDGLDAAYAAPPAELEAIRTGLLAADAADPVAGHSEVTIADAIRFLCLDVARKHEAELTVDKYPKAAGIHDDNKVSATPIEKVYEHGFYPLQGGFRVDPAKPDPSDPDRHFQLFDQWTEVLPTDQIVPVPVRYDPITGRQITE